MIVAEEKKSKISLKKSAKKSDENSTKSSRSSSQATLESDRPNLIERKSSKGKFRISHWHKRANQKYCIIGTVKDAKAIVATSTNI